MTAFANTICNGDKHIACSAGPGLCVCVCECVCLCVQGAGGGEVRGGGAHAHKHVCGQTRVCDRVCVFVGFF